jgi:hypothetical protein
MLHCVQEQGLGRRAKLHTEDFWETEICELFLFLYSEFVYHDNQHISEGCGSLPALFWQVEKYLNNA